VANVRLQNNVLVVARMGAAAARFVKVSNRQGFRGISPLFILTRPKRGGRGRVF
jgi:hypothetical protein